MREAVQTHKKFTSCQQHSQEFSSFLYEHILFKVIFGLRKHCRDTLILVLKVYPGYIIISIEY